MKKILSITIALLLVLSLASCKNSSNEISGALADYIGGTNEAVAKSVTTIEDKTASDKSKNISISAKQAINDHHNMIVLLEVTSLNDMEFNVDTKIKNAFANVKDMDGININEIAYYPSKDKKSMDIILNGFSDKKLNNQDISLKLIDFYDDKSKATIEKAQWNLEFTLKGQDISKEVQVQKSFVHNDLTVNLNTIEISPYSVYATFEGDISKNAKLGVKKSTLNKLDIKIIMKNGEKVSIDMVRDRKEWNDAKTKYKGYVWGKPMSAIINLDDIASISVNDTQFDI